MAALQPGLSEGWQSEWTKDSYHIVNKDLVNKQWIMSVWQQKGTTFADHTTGKTIQVYQVINFFI